MTDNHLPAKWADHQGFTDDRIAKALAEVSASTGFVPGGEVQRRWLYDRDKTWRVRIGGMLNGVPAVLRLENLELEEAEEGIREAFRHQATGSKVRPPNTFASMAFDAAKGYGFSLDEEVAGSMLFDPARPANLATEAFMPFYRALRTAVTVPFWPNEEGDTKTFTAKQANGWLELAKQKNLADVERVWPTVQRLRERMLEALTGAPLRFMHPHLGGADVRRNEAGEYVVFVNHLWSWRQPAYDLAFPIWNQWMALPLEKRTARAIEEVTETWLRAVDQDLGDLIDDANLYPMLLNRLYGSLLLDIPARFGQGEEREAILALEAAFLAEAERLLGA